MTRWPPDVLLLAEKRPSPLQRTVNCRSVREQTDTRSAASGNFAFLGHVFDKAKNHSMSTNFIWTRAATR